MPFSSTDGKQETLVWFQQNRENIKTVLDVGVGSGTYYNLLAPSLPEVRWEGVEVWQPYITQYALKSKYKHIYHKDIRKLKLEKKYDVGIAGDILEHITKKEAIEVVNKLLESCKVLIISIPIIYCPQDAYEGNPYEVHVKPDWTDEEIKETWANNIVQSWSTKDSIVGVYWLTKETK
jgi:predicted TPR repeat methyltransferase